MRRREDEERGTSKSAGRSEPKAVAWVMAGTADLKKTKGQGHEHLCYTGMPVRNGNLRTDRTTTGRFHRYVCDILTTFFIFETAD